jgi:hypothetical protein
MKCDFCSKETVSVGKTWIKQKKTKCVICEKKFCENCGTAVVCNEDFNTLDFITKQKIHIEQGRYDLWYNRWKSWDNKNNPLYLIIVAVFFLLLSIYNITFVYIPLLILLYMVWFPLAEYFLGKRRREILELILQNRQNTKAIEHWNEVHQDNARINNHVKALKIIHFEEKLIWALKFFILVIIAFATAYLGFEKTSLLILLIFIFFPPSIFIGIYIGNLVRSFFQKIENNKWKEFFERQIHLAEAKNNLIKEKVVFQDILRIMREIPESKNNMIQGEIKSKLKDVELEISLVRNHFNHHLHDTEKLMKVSKFHEAIILCEVNIIDLKRIGQNRYPDDSFIQEQINFFMNMESTCRKSLKIIKQINIELQKNNNLLHEHDYAKARKSLLAQRKIAMDSKLPLMKSKIVDRLQFITELRRITFYLRKKKKVKIQKIVNQAGIPKKELIDHLLLWSEFLPDIQLKDDYLYIEGDEAQTKANVKKIIQHLDDTHFEELYKNGK